jgi:starch synthase
MKKKRILFVSQEFSPYTPENILSTLVNRLPQEMNDAGYEVRIFMPRFGFINERRHQLHEVIRLSGMNLPINDMDQPLIIKVASIPNARIQVYFIDNEDFFKRKSTFADDSGKLHKDNDERALFFNRGVLETVKKLGWAPDIIHCHGWMTSLMPVYLRTQYADDPIFSDSKVVYSVYNQGFDGTIGFNIHEKTQLKDLPEIALKGMENPTFDNLNEMACKLCDGVIYVDLDVKSMSDQEASIASEGDVAEAYKKFYADLLVAETVA